MGKVIHVKLVEKPKKDWWALSLSILALLISAYGVWHQSAEDREQARRVRACCLELGMKLWNANSDLAKGKYKDVPSLERDLYASAHVKACTTFFKVLGMEETTYAYLTIERPNAYIQLPTDSIKRTIRSIHGTEAGVALELGYMLLDLIGTLTAKGIDKNALISAGLVGGLDEKIKAINERLATLGIGDRVAPAQDATVESFTDMVRSLRDHISGDVLIQ